MAVQRIHDPHDAVGGIEVTDSDGDQLTVQGRFGEGRDGVLLAGTSDSYQHHIPVSVPLAESIALNEKLGEFITHQCNDVDMPVPVHYSFTDADGNVVMVVSRHACDSGGVYFCFYSRGGTRCVPVAVDIRDLGVVHGKLIRVIEEQQEAGE